MSLSTSTIDSYLFHGLRLDVRSVDGPVAEALANRLAHFAAPARGEVELRVDIVSAEPGDIERPTGRGRPVYDPPDGEVLSFDDGDLLFIRCGDLAQVVCEPRRGAIRMAVRPDPTARWLAGHALFTLTLIECLKRRGRFSLHAAGLAIGGRGILVAGASGSGKSTTAVCLLRAGFGFLADDTVFLSAGPATVDESGSGEDLTVLAFPDEIDVTDQTIGLFPELSAVVATPANPVNGKRQFRPEAIYDAEPVGSCRPVALVLAGARTPGRSRLWAVGPDEALLAVVPNVLLTEPGSTQAHLDVLAQLTRTCACYRLEAGPRLEELPELFAGLM